MSNVLIFGDGLYLGSTSFMPIRRDEVEPSKPANHGSAGAENGLAGAGKKLVI